MKEKKYTYIYLYLIRPGAEIILRLFQLQALLSTNNKAGVDLVLIQPFPLYYVNHVFLALTSIFLSKIYIRKGSRFYQIKVNLSLTFTQRLGH